MELVLLMTMTNDTNNSLFNADVKNRFLDIQTEGTRPSYERIFKITQKTEAILGRDINSFSENEIEAVLYGFEARNRSTIESYARIISSYLHWSVKNGLASKNILEDYKPEDFEKFLDNEEEYLTERKLRRYEDQCANYQDVVIVRLLFIGVGGRQLSEIRNLTKNDIDWERKQLRLINTLKADNDGKPLKYTERYLTVDQRTLDLIEGAINQRTYIKRNGFLEQTESNNIRIHTDLVENDYVIRPSLTKTDVLNAPADKFVVYRRIQVLSDTLGLDLTAKYIQRSGMVYHASEMIKNNGTFGLDEVKIIANRFNVKSYHNLKGFLNVETIKETYPTQKTKIEGIG
jgi:integrase